MSGKYEALGTEIGKLCDEKNAAYGSSFSKTADFFRLLYPDGIKPEQYQDALLQARIFDKQMRIATSKDALGENPYRDISGYGMLGAGADQDAQLRKFSAVPLPTPKKHIPDDRLCPDCKGPKPNGCTCCWRCHYKKYPDSEISDKSYGIYEKYMKEQAEADAEFA